MFLDLNTSATQIALNKPNHRKFNTAILESEK